MMGFADRTINSVGDLGSMREGRGHIYEAPTAQAIPT
jgi:hypothetical protein